MWLFGKRRTKRADEDVVEGLNALATAHNKLVEQFEDLKRAHFKLRGQFYAGKEPKETKDEPTSRDELRAQLVRQGRFIPGQAPRHQEK